MYEYLEKCGFGCWLKDDTLQDEITKGQDGRWEFNDDGRALTPLEIVNEMRFVISEDGGDPDKCFVSIEPVSEEDKILIKQEVAAGEAVRRD